MSSNKKLPCGYAVLLPAMLLLPVISGCEPVGLEATARAAADDPAPGPETSGVAVEMSQGWCYGHGVPESVCTRCNQALVAAFTQAGDWCFAHMLPESQCEECNPGVTARWAALAPSQVDTAEDPDRRRGDVGQGTVESGATIPPGFGPATSAVPIDLSRGWCREHGVPESVCTRCNASLIPQFKESNDWCSGHGLPETQCSLCNPQVREKWAVMRPAPSKDAASSADFNLERRPRLLTGTSDPLCPVESLKVRFLDPSVVKRAGIRTEAAGVRRISATIDVPAEVEFDATKITRLTPRVSGIARQVVAELGDTVNAGDVLAILDSPVLGEAKSRYIEREQNHLLAVADLERVQTICEGQENLLAAVTEEATLEEIRPKLAGVPVGAAKARLLRAHAALQLARVEADRETRLLEKEVGSERDFDAAQSALAAAEADFFALREEIAFASDRDRLAAEREVKIARAALDAAERELHILGLTDEQVQAIGSGPDTKLSRYELRSPVAGRVIERAVAAGEAVDATDVLFVVVDNARMWLIADVYAPDLLLLQEGVPVLFTVDGLRGVSFEGTLEWISSRLDDRTRTVRVRANLPNENGLLRAKMFGEARLVVRDETQVLSVPSEAVQTDGCCQLVFVKEDETLFTPRKVALGATAGGYVEVLRGLEAGEAVATTGSFLMKTEILKGNIGAGCCEVDPGR